MWDAGDGRLRDRRSRPGRVGGPGHGRRGRARARAPARRARLEAARPRPEREVAARAVRRWAVAVGVGPRVARGVRRARDDGRVARRRASRARAARRAGLLARSHRARRQPRLPRGSAIACHHGDQGRRDVPGGGRRVVRGEGHARPHDDARRRSTTRPTTSSRTWATRRRCTRPRWLGTVRARSTAARGSSWTGCAGAGSRLRLAGSSSSDARSPREGQRWTSIFPRCMHEHSTRRGGASPVCGDDQWGTCRDCEDWTVRELVNHIVTGNYWAEELGRGKTIEDGRRPARRRRARRRPVGTTTTRRSVAAAAFRAPGAMDAPCAVSYGPVPGSVYCGHRFIDVLIHGWDVATSTGQDTTLDPELVDACCGGRRAAARHAGGQRGVRHGGEVARRRRRRRRSCSQCSAAEADAVGLGHGSVHHRHRAEGASPSVRIFDLNRSITGMAIERYPSVEKVRTGRPRARRAGPAPVRPRRRLGHRVLERRWRWRRRPSGGRSSSRR